MSLELKNINGNGGFTLVNTSNDGEFYLVVNGPNNSPSPSAPPSSPSLTPSSTPSISVSLSITPTVTPSLSLGASPSATVSITPSVTPSVSLSVTPSVTPSTSLSVTPSITPSTSLNVTPSITPSITRTPSVTPSSSTPTYYYYSARKFDCGSSCAQVSPDVIVRSSTPLSTIDGVYYKPLGSFTYQIQTEVSGPIFDISLDGAPSNANCISACSL